MVHRRDVNGQEAVFGNQGALWGNAMTWFDHETGSVWSQPIGEAIAGPLKGERLELLPVSLTRWDSWQDNHPDTLALAVESSGRSGFDLVDMSIVVELADDVAAYPYVPLAATGVVNDTVAGVPLAVVVDPDDDQTWIVFSRQLDDAVVELAVEDGRLVDVTTGSVFDTAIGRAVDGPLEGEILDRLPGFTAFPRDYERFWPDGRVWPFTD